MSFPDEPCDYKESLGLAQGGVGDSGKFDKIKVQINELGCQLQNVHNDQVQIKADMKKIFELIEATAKIVQQNFDILAKLTAEIEADAGGAGEKEEVREEPPELEDDTPIETKTKKSKKKSR